MSLERYIKKVGCLSPRASIVEAAREMKDSGVGTVVVISDDYQPIGLVTDRDIVMRIVANDQDLGHATIENVMTSGVHSLSQDASIQDATELMRDKGVRRIPILDENRRITGIVTFDDLILLLGAELGNLANAVLVGLSRTPEEAERREGR